MIVRSTLMKKALLVLIIVFLSPAAHAQDLKKRPFKGFSSMHPKFQAMCEAMRNDGRLDAFLQILVLNSDRDATCESCRPLMKEMSSACKTANRPPKEKKPLSKKESEETAAPEAGGEPSPTATPTATPYVVQREPSTIVLDRTGRVFSAIAEDTQINVRSIPAVQKLLFLLRDKRSVQSGAEQEYFDVLAEYISSSFRDVIEEQAQKPAEEGEPSPEVQQKNLGSLFDDE